MVVRINSYGEELLQELALDNYISELITHCDHNFSHLKQTMGEEKLRQALKIGVQKAEEIGFTQRGSVRFYIELLIIFGFEFETDPQYSWLVESLKNSNYKTELDKASKVFDEVNIYQEKLLGSNNQYFLETAQKLEKLSIHTIKIYKTHFENLMLAILRDLYPQKFSLSTKEGVQKLILQGVKKAQSNYGFEEPAHIALIIILMFLLGHDFDQDPFYEWASLEKTNQHHEFPVVKAERLEKRSRIWLHTAMHSN